MVWFLMVFKFDPENTAFFHGFSIAPNYPLVMADIAIENSQL